MTTATFSAPAPATTLRTTARLSFGRVLRSEWVKFRSVRSTWWTMGSTVVVMMLFGVVMAASLNFAATRPEEAGALGSVSTVQTLVLGYIFAQLALAVLGALSMTTEYSTGMIRSTFSAVPARLPAFWAKVVVVAAVSLVVAVVGLAASYLVVAPLLAGNDLVPDLGDRIVQRVLLACAGYLTCVAVLAVAVGAILRHPAGTIFTLATLLFVVPMITEFVPHDGVQDVVRFLPMNLGTAMMAVTAADAGRVEVLTPGAAALALGVWTVVPLAVAALLLRRRDV